MSRPLCQGDDPIFPVWLLDCPTKADFLWRVTVMMRQQSTDTPGVYTAQNVSPLGALPANTDFASAGKRTILSGRRLTLQSL